MKLRVCVEDLEDDRRQAVVAYVTRGPDGRPRIESVVQQADAGKAREAAAACVAAGLHAAGHVGEEEVRERLAEYEPVAA